MNAKLMRNSLGLILPAVLLTMPADAQQRYRASLPPVPAAAYYRIALTPAVTAFAAQGGPDLRILSPGNKEVPYLLADSLKKAVYTPVPAPDVSQRDSSDHFSYIRLRFNAPYQVDRLSFRFGGARLFKRAAILLSRDHPAASLMLMNTGPATIMTDLHERELLLRIDNEDNPPLQLRSVVAEQRRRHLLAWLEPGMRYTLTCGDPALSAPVYDLRHFRDSITRLAGQDILPDSLTVIRTMATPEKAAVTPEPLLGKGMMWAITLLVLGGLTIGTVSLMRQMNRRA